MYCRKCGKDNPDHAAYCGDCGANLNGSSSPPQGVGYGNNNLYGVAPQKSAGLGIVLSVICVGLGHLYAGAISKGLILMVLYTILVSIAFLSLIILNAPLMIILFISSLILWIWSIYDTNNLINQYNQHIRNTGNPPW